MAKTQVGKFTLSMPEIGGMPQAIVAMEDDTRLPVALMLHGGPGEALTPSINELAYLEDRFVICLWDQRGAGKSYSADIPPKTTTVDKLVSDTVEVTRWLLQKYHRKKLVLFGYSWGSLLGILAAQKAPELYAAYIGVGQIANQMQSEQLAYALVLQRAESQGDAKAIKNLRKIGCPPYPEQEAMKRLMHGRKVFRKYNQSPGKQVSLASFFLKVFTCPFYTLRDKRNYFKAMMGGGKLFLEVMGIDLLHRAPRLEVPVYVMQGKYDLQTMPQIAEAYVDALEAPDKAFVLFEQSGHMPSDDEPEALKRKLESIVALKEPWLIPIRQSEQNSWNTPI